jgi:hypothetical protein
MSKHIFIIMTDYLAYVDQLVANKKTSGPNQSGAMVHYTELALRRMKRWSKTGKVIPEMIEAIEAIHKPQNWLILTEAWCGDAAHSFMFIEKMADLNEHITLEWKLRDENLDLMDLYLTNGGRAIPKLIAYDENRNELYNWGPRPKHIQEKYWEMKEAGFPYKEAAIELQKLYNEDKGVTMQKEILELMQ